ncbi:MAG: anaerobic ribonucleoside-triphosphate reductase activating protein [Muribaculaceae bacterium]|nr:anaerobic ribonucleoside-triphosphate reductase activating protein [Muribaculaceae bacterium]
MNYYYNVLDIRRGTTVDGPGFRTSVYLAGCRHNCPGCHNPESWDPDGGLKMTLEEIMAVIEEEDFDVTLTGGDPLINPETTAALAEAIKSRGYNIWLYTGFTIEQILADPRLKQAIRNIDTIVEGPFIESLRDPDLLFRGSSNQRIINLSIP